MIHVIATITVKPDTRDKVLDAFRWVTPLVRAEDGCIEYQATVDVKTTSPAQDGPRENVITVVEKWASVEALYAHSAASHMTEYRAKVKDYVVSVKLHVTEAA
jgi:quinol monooxygenase YgiN